MTVMHGVLHITRSAVIPLGQLRAAICGAAPRINAYQVGTYYMTKDDGEERLGGVWCPACKAELSPLEELEHTEL